MVLVGLGAISGLIVTLVGAYYAVKDKESRGAYIVVTMFGILMLAITVFAYFMIKSFLV